MNKKQYIEYFKLKNEKIKKCETISEAICRIGEPTKSDIVLINKTIEKQSNNVEEVVSCEVKEEKVKKIINEEELKKYLLENTEELEAFIGGYSDLETYKCISDYIMEQEDCYSTHCRIIEYNNKEYSIYYSKDNKEQETQQSDYELLNDIL